MKELLEQARACFDAAIYMPALVCYLVVPDGAAAVEYPGLPNRVRYPRWFDEFVPADLGMTGNQAWGLRNAIMHEGKAGWKTKLGFDAVVITLPNRNDFFVNGNSFRQQDDILLTYSLLAIAHFIEAGYCRWHDTISDDREKIASLDGFLQYRPFGSDRIRGIPVIS